MTKVQELRRLYRRRILKGLREEWLFTYMVGLIRSREDVACFSSVRDEMEKLGFDVVDCHRALDLATDYRLIDWVGYEKRGSYWVSGFSVHRWYTEEVSKMIRYFRGCV